MQVIQRGGFTAVVASPASIGLSVRSVGGQHVVPQRLSQVMGLGTSAAINGPMFALCAGHAGGYSTTDCNTLNYLHYTRSGGLLAPLTPGVGLVLSIVRDWTSVRAEMDRVANPAAVMAVQGYPTLLLDGRNVTSPELNLERVWRSGVGLMADGRVMLAVAVGSMSSFADQMEDAGARRAVYTDGGDSTALGFGSRRVGADADRPVASWITIDTLPRLPYLAMAGVAGGLGAAGYWAYKKKMLNKKSLRKLLGA